MLVERASESINRTKKVHEVRVCKNCLGEDCEYGLKKGWGQYRRAESGTNNTSSNAGREAWDGRVPSKFEPHQISVKTKDSWIRRTEGT